MVENSFNNFKKTKHKNRLYKFLGAFTIIYVILQLATFHFQLEAMSPQLVFFWMGTLLFYTVLKDFFSYVGINCENNQKGEFYAMLVMGAFLWMGLFNLIRTWGLGLKAFDYPHFIFESAMEALALMVLSLMFSLWVHRKNCNNNGQACK